MERQSTSLNFGIGLFETMRVKAGKIEYLQEHLNRLFTSIDALNVTWSLTIDQVQEALMAYVTSNDLVDCAIKCVINEPSTLTITHRRLTYGVETYEKGFKISISDVKRHSSNPLLKHKTTNYWLNMLVRNHLESNEESLFVNEDGALMEGTVSNIFVIDNNCIKTPSLDCGLLPGIMRDKIIETCSNHHLSIEEKPLYLDDLLMADSLFISNSLMGVMPVYECIGMPKKSHKYVKLLMEVLNGTHV